MSTEKITLIDYGKVFQTAEDIAHILNTFCPIYCLILKYLNALTITSVFKKGEGYSKNDYRQASILLNAYMILEKCMFCQMSFYVDQFLTKHK